MEMIHKLLLISLISFVGFCNPVFADDNEITIKQEGDNFELDITQIGYNNVVKQWTSSEGIDGSDNTIIIKQARDRGNKTQPNTIELRRLWGDGNTLKLIKYEVIEKN